MRPTEPEIIYERKYPHEDYPEECELDEEAAEKPQTEKLSFDEIMEQIYRGVTYTPIPERMEASKDFIGEAVKISKLYEIDIKILRHIDHISAYISFDCGGGMRYINRLFGMADEVCFFKDSHGRDLTVSLYFYTHTVMKDGRVVAP